MFIPLERKGYTYIVCAAGGALALSGPVGGTEQRRSITTDLRQLSRTLTFNATAATQFNYAVLQQCGETITMNVRCRSLCVCACVFTREYVRVACVRRSPHDPIV